MAVLLGLTGKSCSGKNYVSEYMASLGWEVLDLDKMCHYGILENADRIVRIFGTTDRKIIAAQVFESPEKLRLLESVLYPWLKLKIKDIVSASTAPFVVLNGALLYRGDVDKDCKAVIFVDASYETRLKRALVRDSVSEEMFIKREASQSDVDFRTVHYRCPVIVINNETDCSKDLVDICNKMALDY